MNGFGIIFPDWQIPKENPLRTLKEPILFTDWELQKVSCEYWSLWLKLTLKIFFWDPLLLYSSPCKRFELRGN